MDSRNRMAGMTLLLWFIGSTPLERAPDFMLPDTRGKQVALADVKARTVVLNFWAFWCDTWKEELPRLKELASLQEAEDFALIAIAVDGKRLEQFKSRTGGDTPFPVLLDETGLVTKAFGVAHVPTVIILDAQRGIRYRQKGVPRLPQLLEEIRRAGKG